MKWIFILIFSWAFSCSGAIAQDKSGAPIVLSLKEVLQSVDTLNFKVIMANARLEGAIARIAEAQSGLLPHLDGTMSGGRQSSDLRAEGLKIPIPGLEDHIGPYNTFDARPRLTMALFDPSAFERFQAAKKGQTLSEAQLEKTREDILALVADLYVDAKRREQTVKYLKTLLDKDQMAYEISENSLSQGTETELNSNKFKSELDQAKYLYQEAQQEALDASLDLGAALQLPLGRPLAFLDDRDFIKELEHKAYINFKDATNADMQVAQSELEDAKADQKAATADFLPKVVGSADYGRSGGSPSNGSNTFGVGVAVSVPIWEGGDNQAKLKVAQADVKEAQENLLDTTQQEQVDIAKARAAIADVYALKKSKTQALQTAQKSLRIALHAQEIGTGSVLEVMEAKADLAEAEDDFNEAEASWVMAHIDLLHAEGHLRALIKKG